MNPATDISPAQGEIGSLADSPLAAGNLDDHKVVEAREVELGYGDGDDERAIERITKRLRQSKALRDEPTEAIVERAESLYALCCGQVAGGASGEQLTRIAELVGEEPDKLKQRLA